MGNRHSITLPVRKAPTTESTATLVLGGIFDKIDSRFSSLKLKAFSSSSPVDTIFRVTRQTKEGNSMST